MRDKLKNHIAAVVEGIRHLSVDEADDLIAQVGDEIADDRSDDLFNGAILDGLRWGYHAAVVVEMGGGAIVRFIMPRGINITHEWADDADADAAIKAALAATHVARNIADGVGE